MTAVGGLVTVLTLTALAILLAFAAPPRYRSVASGGASMGIGIAGVFTGIAGITSVPQAVLVVPIAIPGGLGIDPLLLSPTPLGGVFCVVVGAVSRTVPPATAVRLIVTALTPTAHGIV